jgi:hypothetical protein
MANTPIQFWAIIICTLGAALGLAALFAPHADTQARTMAFTLANSLVSGGLGAFTASHIATRYTVGPGNPTKGAPTL